MIETMKHVGLTVLHHRIEKGWTQTELAGRTGLSQSTISRVEHGAWKDIKLKTLIVIAGALGFAVSFRFDVPGLSPK